MVGLMSTRPGTIPPSSPRLTEVARHVAKPSGIVSTGWPAVEKTCREKLGIEFDEWQKGAGRLILAKRADGSLAATVGGAAMSLPRQVGKTYLLAGMIFGLCVNTPGLLVIWSAHHARTHGETFLAMQAFAQRSRVKPYISQVFTGSGDEEIRFVNGSRILFGARERGFGRGIPGVDVLVMDEAQILSDKAMENMLATLNTSRFGLHLYIGTPPKPEDIEARRSELFIRMRLEALSGESEELLWIECGAEDGADPDDRKQYAKANPSYPHRTPLTSIKRMRKMLTLDGFLREGLGIWPDDTDVVIFDMARWASPPLLDRDVEPPSRAVLTIAVSPDRRWACIGVAGESDGGKTVVLCHSIRGLAGVAAKVAELQESRDIVEVGLAGAAAKTLIPDLVKAGVEFVEISQVQMGAACGAFQQAFRDGAIVHVGQPELDAAVANAQTRRVGEAEQWDRRDVKIDDSPLVAVSAALFRYGLQESPVPAIW